MSKYISQYTEQTTVEDTDLLLIQRGLTYYKVQKSNVASASNLESVLAVGNNSGAYDIEMKGNQGVRFYNPLDTFYTKILSGAQGGNLTLTLPTTAGSASQFLQTNGSGTLTWATALTGSLTSGRVPYASGTSTLTDSANLYWDNTNVRLGIGTSSPSNTLHVYSASAVADLITLTEHTSNSWTSNIRVKAGDAQGAMIAYGTAVGGAKPGNIAFTNLSGGKSWLASRGGDIWIGGDDSTASTPAVYVSYSSSNVGIGVSPLSTVKLLTKGSDSTSSNFNYRAEDSGGNVLYTLRNDGKVTSNAKGTNPFEISATSNGSTSSQSNGLYVSLTTVTGASTTTIHGIHANVNEANIFSATTNVSGVYGYVYGGTKATNIMGVRGYAARGNSKSYGGYFQADDASPNNYGIYAEAQYATTTANYAGYFLALNSNPSNTCPAYGVYSSTQNYKNSGTVYGAYIAAVNTNAATSGTIYGLYVSATTGNGTSTNYAIVTNGGNVGIGTTTPSAQALMELSSTTQALLIMRMTSTQGSAITAANGMMIYVTDTNGTFTSVGFWGYENGAWVKL